MIVKQMARRIGEIGMIQGTGIEKGLMIEVEKEVVTGIAEYRTSSGFWIHVAPLNANDQPSDVMLLIE
jgi:hypothetical protein